MNICPAFARFDRRDATVTESPNTSAPSWMLGGDRDRVFQVAQNRITHVDLTRDSSLVWPHSGTAIALCGSLDSEMNVRWFCFCCWLGFFGATPCLSAGAGVLSFLDGNARLLRGTTWFAVVEGIRIQSGAI